MTDILTRLSQPATKIVKTKLVKMWAIGYVRNGERALSVRIYSRCDAQLRVKRLRALGNDAYLAGSLQVRVSA